MSSWETTAHKLIFLSTPSARRATAAEFTMGCKALPFLSTPSARRATPKPFWPVEPQLGFLSTPSARRATGVSAHISAS